MKFQFWDEHRTILLIAAAGLAVRLLAVPVLHQDGYTGDEKEYVYLGHQVSTGSGFVDSNGDYSSRSPLFPFLLGGFFTVFGSGLLLPHVTGCLLGTIGILLVYILTLRLFRDKRTALYAACAAAVYPGLIVYSALLQTESLYIVFFLCAMLSGYALTSKPSVLQGMILGVFSGLAMLTRGVYLAFFPFFLFAIWWVGRRHGSRLVYSILVCILAFIIMNLPWAVRNYSVQGALVPVSLYGGTSMLIGNNPFATGTWSTKPGFEEWLDGELRNAGMEDWASLSERERNTVGRQLAVQFISGNPAEALLLAIKKAHIFLVFPITNSDSNVPLQLIAVASDILLLSGMAVGLVVLQGTKTASLLPLTIAFLVFTLVHVVLHAEARYRLPLMPLLCMVFAHGVRFLSVPRAIRMSLWSHRKKFMLASLGMIILVVYGYTGALFLEGRI